MVTAPQHQQHTTTTTTEEHQMTTTPNDGPLTRDDGSPMYVGRHLQPAAQVDANLLHDVVEIMEASDEGGWHQLAPGTSTTQHLADGYGNQVELWLPQGAHYQSLQVTVRWAASDQEERLGLDPRGGATRVARTVLVLCDAPDDDSNL